MGNCMTGTASASGNAAAKATATNNNNDNNNDNTTANGKGAVNSDKNKTPSPAPHQGHERNGGLSNQSNTIHSGILKEHKLDVYEKYTETEVLGKGSMGHVAKVVIKEGAVGGSAYVGGSVGGSGSARAVSKTARNAEKAKNYLQASSSVVSDTDSPISSVTESNRSSVTQQACYALKSIQLDRVSTAFIKELKNEIDILKTMDHPNIVKLHEVFSHKKQIYMILELCDGGDLYTRLPYTEKDSAYITGKLLSAIKYMHAHAIVHRDLKFENIMFENKSPSAEIKVIDFGLSKKFISSKLGVMREGVGTLYSMAPQVLQGVYNSQADMWSVGVITYMLLSSHRPFYSKKKKVMIDRIMRCDYSYKKDYWNPISDDAKDFVDNLLVLDPKVRYDAEKAQKHKWMHKTFKLEDRAPTESVTSRVNSTLLAYKNNLTLKKLALNVIAHRSSTTEIINLRKAFDQFDTGNDGVISSEEFKVAMKDKCNYSEEELKEMFTSIDINKTGTIMYTEFIAATLEAQGQVDEDRIAEAFDRLDVDNTGSISKENMVEFLGDTNTNMEDVERMIEGADLDHCGQVSFDEFLAMFRSTNEETSYDMKASLKNFESDARESVADGSGDSSETNSENLVGLDAVIPGGKYDDLERQQQEQEQEQKQSNQDTTSTATAATATE